MSTVDVTYNGDKSYQNAFTVAVEGYTVARVPVAFLKGLGQDIDTNDNEKLGEFGNKVLTPLFEKVYADVDVKAIRQQVFSPVGEADVETRHGKRHIDAHQDTFAETRFQGQVAPYNDQVFAVLRAEV